MKIKNITNIKTNTKCKSWKYYKLINRESKYYVCKVFHTKIEAICFKFIIILRLLANHNVRYLKRNTWYQ
jgi:hypothetical protein